MAWLQIVPRPHECPTPDRAAVVKANAVEGSTWQCDQCSRKFRLVKLIYYIEGGVADVVWKEYR